MGLFPQLQEADVGQIQRALADLLEKSEAVTALLVEKAGYLIAQTGDTKSFNTTELATLASHAFAATHEMTTRLGEENLTSMYQEGERLSMLWVNVDEDSVLVIVFRTTNSVGAVKYYAEHTAREIARQLDLARIRDPENTFDLATLDPADAEQIFRRKK